MPVEKDFNVQNLMATSLQLNFNCLRKYWYFYEQLGWKMYQENNSLMSDNRDSRQTPSLKYFFTAVKQRIL